MRVFIGVDPHKLSATIEVVDTNETVLAKGRFDTNKAGYAAMRRHVAAWPDRVWAVEGSGGAGRPLAQRLLADDERVVDVPPKLSARARLFDTGHNRKTDAHDAHAVAAVAVRTKGLRVLCYDADLEVLRMLTDRRAELISQRVQTVNRLQRLLSELIPGEVKLNLTAPQAREILSRRRPRDLAGKTCKRLALEQLEDLSVIERRIKAADKELKALVIASGSRLLDLPGIGPIGAARILADVGDIARFADRNRFASWTGTAPLDASSGEQVRHRLSRAGNRKINHMLHMAALSQIRLDTDGRAYYRRKRSAGKTHLEALRCLKRRISDAVYRQLLDDTAAAVGAGPGGQGGTSQESSAADSHPLIGTSDKPLPDPRPRRYAATSQPRKPQPVEALREAG
ncbi:IS110 family transposase [Nocardioides aromaticivorans]|uniref:IS110 family transposase n=1 Tax=Nocardioides aromaticivorans TaxID=200618 RepID=A0ABX7PM19_9ACTN|nr:IS110 family transposase [Nocardioides aromaticivorans]QSR26874.1 IS110 family transposase [Nocardioides aromaticivorans]